MNFANKLMASAEKAASAAKNFKGFDEMAEEDDYIHSEGLNVKSRPRQQEQESKPLDPWIRHQADRTDEANESHASAEPSWSLLDRPTRASPTAAEANNNRNAAPSYSRNSSTISSASPASSISPPRQRPPYSTPNTTTGTTKPAPQEAKRAGRGGFSKHRNQAASQQQPQSTNTTGGSRPNPYLSVVSDALQDGSSVSKSSRRRDSGYDTDNEEGSNTDSSDSSGTSSNSSSDDESGSDDDEEDPILSQIRQSKKKSSSRKQQRRQKERKKKKKQQARKEKKKTKKKKNPRRFLEDLDQRGAMAAMEFAQGQQNNQQQQPLEMEQPQSSPANSAFSSLKGWIANPLQKAASANPNGIAAKATSFLKRGPLSRARSAPAATQQVRPDEEDFQVLSSNNVLGDDELAALAQFSNNNQTSLLSPRGLLQLARKHPRESFILFTFLLGVFVYFFNRKNSNEDDVQ